MQCAENEDANSNKTMIKSSVLHRYTTRYRNKYKIKARKVPYMITRKGTIQDTQKMFSQTNDNALEGTISKFNANVCLKFLISVFTTGNSIKLSLKAFPIFSGDSKDAYDPSLTSID